MNEENNNPAQNTPETPNTSESTPTPSHEPNLTEQEIQKKKGSFQKKVKLIGFLIIGTVAAVSLFAIGKFAYNKTKSTYSTQQTSETTSSSQEIITIPDDQPKKTNEWEIFASDKYGFSFEYPKGDPLYVSDISKDEFLVEVNSSDIVPAENPTGENLIKGYIFQIKPLKLETRDLESAVSVKKNSYYTLCPDTTSITDIVDNKVSEIEGRGFKIYNCNADYSVDFVAAGNYIYEITQIYKGDVGFKQVYKAKINQIFKSVVINQNLPEEPTHIVYQGKYGFSFSYPNYFDSLYSDTPYPPQATVEKLVTVAENDNTNAMGFYYAKGGKEFDFNIYVEEQIQLLIDDYTVVKGHAPEGIQTDLIVSGENAVMLENYTWEGNDLIYIPLPEVNGALIISKTNISEELFDDIIDSIFLERD